jgi:glucose-1-phosphate thymidylyltransferase
MKGIILAGGMGSRLYPLTKVTNKHLLPVGKEPMIFNPIRVMIQAGVTDIMVVTSKEHMGDIVNQLGSGREFNCQFTYRVQEEAKGIAHALLLAENFAGQDRIFVILGDNITTGNLKPHVDEYLRQEKGAKVLLKRVGDPERYGVAAIDEKQIVDIEEKPAQPRSNFAVIGYYMYDQQVWSIIRGLTPSNRGEYEITAVNNAYVHLHQLTYGVLEADWTDAGTFESLEQANAMMFNWNRR